MSVFPRKVHEGDHLVVDDRTGFTVWARKPVKEVLTGFIVESGRADPRNPQEFLRTRADKQSVKDPRAPQVSAYAGPLITTTTAAAATAALSVEVESVARFLTSDRIRIQLSNGDYFPTIVVDASGTTVTILDPLPESVAIGAIVQNLSASSTVSFQ